MKILLVSALRDEGPYVVEWVAHHRALGVTDFLLFTNDCSDGTPELLEALAPAGVIHQVNAPPVGKSLQWNALHQAWAHPLRKAADWLMCIDSDEFVNLRAPMTTLGDLVTRMGGADAITLPWRMFGHSGHARIPDAMTLEAFVRAAPEACSYPILARQFKTLFRARGPFRQIGVHRPRLKKDHRAAWLDGSGVALPEGFDLAEHRLTLFGLPAASDWVQLNHYSLRAAESYMLKRLRGLPNRQTKALDMSYWTERNFNTEEERSIAHLLPATKAEMAKLLDLPGVADLHRKALAQHRARFAAQLRTPEEVKFYGRLLMAANAHVLPEAVVSDLVALYHRAQDDHDG